MPVISPRPQGRQVQGAMVATLPLRRVLSLELRVKIAISRLMLLQVMAAGLCLVHFVLLYQEFFVLFIVDSIFDSFNSSAHTIHHLWKLFFILQISNREEMHHEMILQLQALFLHLNSCS